MVKYENIGYGQHDRSSATVSVFYEAHQSILFHVENVLYQKKHTKDVKYLRARGICKQLFLASRLFGEKK